MCACMCVCVRVCVCACVCACVRVCVCACVGLLLCCVVLCCVSLRVLDAVVVWWWRCCGVISWQGPFDRLTASAPLCGRPDGTCNNEDPFVWQDTRGNLHLLMHSLGPNGGFQCPPGCDVGTHAFYSVVQGRWIFPATVAFNTTYVSRCTLLSPRLFAVRVICRPTLHKCARIGPQECLATGTSGLGSTCACDS